MIFILFLLSYDINLALQETSGLYSSEEPSKTATSNAQTTTNTIIPTNLPTQDKPTSSDEIDETSYVTKDEFNDTSLSSSHETESDTSKSTTGSTSATPSPTNDPQPKTPTTEATIITSENKPTTAAQTSSSQFPPTSTFDQGHSSIPSEEDSLDYTLLLMICGVIFAALICAFVCWYCAKRMIRPTEYTRDVDDANFEFSTLDPVTNSP